MGFLDFCYWHAKPCPLTKNEACSPKPPHHISPTCLLLLVYLWPDQLTSCRFSLLTPLSYFSDSAGSSSFSLDIKKIHTLLYFRIVGGLNYSDIITYTLCTLFLNIIKRSSYIQWNTIIIQIMNVYECN